MKAVIVITEKQTFYALDNGETLLNRQIRLLSECGAEKTIVLCTDCSVASDKLINDLQGKDFVEIKRINCSEAHVEMAALSCMNEFADNTFLLMKGDVIFDKRIAEKMLTSSDEVAVVINKTKALSESHVKAKLDFKYVASLTTADPVDTVGFFALIPFYKLSVATAKQLSETARRFCENDRSTASIEDAVAELLPAIQMQPYSCEAMFADEITSDISCKSAYECVRIFDFDEQHLFSDRGDVLKIPEIVKSCGSQKPMLICGKSYDKLPVSYILQQNGIEPVRFSDFTSNPRYEDVINGVKLFKEQNCDFILSVGGGSAIDVAKCIKLFSSLEESEQPYFKQPYKYSAVKHLAVPTTAGTGSESTRFAVIYHNGEKISVTHDSIFPDYAILDANLLRNLPDYYKKACLCDALCHAVESMWSVKATPASQTHAKKALSLIKENAAAYFKGKNDRAVDNILLAANYAGRAINISETTAAHAMSYKLSSVYNIAHGHAAMLCLYGVFAFAVDQAYLPEHRTAQPENEKYTQMRGCIEAITANLGVKGTDELEAELLGLLTKFHFRIDKQSNEEQNIDALTRSVNVQRLKNFPLEMNRAQIGQIYGSLLRLYQESKDVKPEVHPSKECLDKRKIEGNVKTKQIVYCISDVLKRYPRLRSKLSFIAKKMLFYYFEFRNGLDTQMVVFESQHGKSAACNPLAIYKAMKHDEKYLGFSFVWALEAGAVKPIDHDIRTKYVVPGSIEYIKSCAQAKYWVSNYGISGYLDPGKDHVWIHTWHGKPLKRIGCDFLGSNNKSREGRRIRLQYKRFAKRITYLLSPAKAFDPCMASAFNLGAVNKENALVTTGYPRNDFLFTFKENDVFRIKMKLGIPFDKKVVLYAPTWRVSNKVKSKQGSKRTNYLYSENLDLNKLSDALGDDYVILFRTHSYEQNNAKNMEFDGNIINVCDVENVNDLYVISDVMISDYSGCIFDYAILNRPMIFYMYDKEEYVCSDTGVYFDLDILPGQIVTEEDELPACIVKSLQNDEYKEKNRAFNELFSCLDGPDCGIRTARTLITGNPQVSKACEAAQKFNIGLRNLMVRTKGMLKSAGFMHDLNYKTLKSYKDIHKGERCFMIGNGPSLRLNDLDALTNEYTFACNLIFKIFELTKWRPSFYCATDLVFSKYSSEEFKTHISSPFFTTSRSYKQMQHKPEKCCYVDYINTPYRVHGNMLEYYVPANATVMTFMIELAIFMGFKEIYLLGVDCSNGFIKGGHFISEYENERMIMLEHKRSGRVIKDSKGGLSDFGRYRTNRSMMAYAILEQYTRRHGIKIYNATRGGYLEEFERVDFDILMKPQNEFEYHGIGESYDKH